MKLISSSIWVLYKSFFDTVPGQKGLLAIGCLLMALGYFQQGFEHAELPIMAGIAFVIGFTLLFAGPHFRKLASLRRHRLLPNFKKYLVISYVMVLVSLSFIAWIGFIFLKQQHPTQFIFLESLSLGVIWLSILAVIFVTSFFGFLPGYLRYPLWLMIIFLVNIQQINKLPVEFLLLAVIVISVISLFCFVYFIGIIKKPIFYTKKTVSLTKYLPGLQGDFQESGVTAVGSILLGISDGNKSRFYRAFFTAFLVPIALTGVVLLADRYSAEQLFQTPVFLFISLITAVIVQIHFAFTVATRRRFIWLRIGGSRQQINQVAQKVLAKERWAIAMSFGLWCAPAIALYPKTAAWLLGVSGLLWSMTLFLEAIILSLRLQLSRRAEFYLLLIFVGIVVSIIALASVHRQPIILWSGVLAMLFLCMMHRLALKMASNNCKRSV